jgi:hypothetical protein
MFETMIETKLRERAIDETAAKLIRGGMAPWPAVITAGRIVDQRRQYEQLYDESESTK